MCFQTVLSSMSSWAVCAAVAHSCTCVTYWLLPACSSPFCAVQDLARWPAAQLPGSLRLVLQQPLRCRGAGGLCAQEGCARGAAEHQAPACGSDAQPGWQHSRRRMLMQQLLPICCSACVDRQPLCCSATRCGCVICCWVVVPGCCGAGSGIEPGAAAAGHQTVGTDVVAQTEPGRAEGPCGVAGCSSL